MGRSPRTLPTFGTSGRARSRDGACDGPRYERGRLDFAAGGAVRGNGPRGGGAWVRRLAGRAAPTSMLLDVARLDREYYERKPELDDATQLVAFGTSGHR